MSHKRQATNQGGPRALAPSLSLAACCLGLVTTGLCRGRSVYRFLLIRPLLMALVATGYPLPATGLAQGLFHAQPGQTVWVRLELKLPPRFALQKRSVFWLEHPFIKGKVLQQSPSGRDWPPDPRHYLQTVSPSLFMLSVPASAKAATYPLRFRATVLACNKELGVCQRHDLSALGRLVVGRKGQDRPVLLEFDPAKPFGL